MSGDWAPAFVGQRPPFPVTHGSYAPKVVGARARTIHRRMKRAWPGLVQSWPALVSELAHVSARIELLREAIDTTGVTSKGSDTLLKHLTSAERQHLRLLEALGLTPAAAARVARDLAQAEVLAHDLPALREAGRRFVPDRVLQGEAEPTEVRDS